MPTATSVLPAPSRPNLTPPAPSGRTRPHSDTIVVSIYLDLEGRRAARTEFEREIEGLVRGLQAQLGDHAGLVSELHRVVEVVRHGIERAHTRGLAIFVGDQDRPFDVVELPVAVPTQVIVSNSPATAVLDALVASQQSVGVVVVDRQHARLGAVEWGALHTHLVVLAEPAPTAEGRERRSRGIHVEQQARAQLAAHARRVADSVRDLLADTGCTQVVIGGTDDVVAEVERRLPAAVAASCGRLDGVSLATSDADLVVAAVGAAAAAERARIADLVARLRDRSAAGPRAVVGLEAVLDALATHRAARVVVSHGFSAEGWRCAACGRLARR
ncbi:MAG: hypothetical protein OEY23_21145, partial [Acidimicrobiia bacterium]|nr:hypothetical protein [Acidimicrobiia bacterium]